MNSLKDLQSLQTQLMIDNWDTGENIEKCNNIANALEALETLKNKINMQVLKFGNGYVLDIICGEFDDKHVYIDISKEEFDLLKKELGK